MRWQYFINLITRWNSSHYYHVLTHFIVWRNKSNWKVKGRKKKFNQIKQKRKCRASIFKRCALFGVDTTEAKRISHVSKAHWYISIIRSTEISKKTKKKTFHIHIMITFFFLLFFSISDKNQNFLFVTCWDACHEIISINYTILRHINKPAGCHINVLYLTFFK